MGSERKLVSPITQLDRMMARRSHEPTTMTADEMRANPLRAWMFAGEKPASPAREDAPVSERVVVLLNLNVQHQFAFTPTVRERLPMSAAEDTLNDYVARGWEIAHVLPLTGGGKSESRALFVLRRFAPTSGRIE